jgi:hypothetical protein
VQRAVFWETLSFFYLILNERQYPPSSMTKPSRDHALLKPEDKNRFSICSAECKANQTNPFHFFHLVADQKSAYFAPD